MNKLNLEISWRKMGILIQDVYDYDENHYKAIKIYSDLSNICSFTLSQVLFDQLEKEILCNRLT